jgi:SAM-dependent methyltransferase
MGLTDLIIHRLVKYKHFKYYCEDEYFIRQILAFSDKKNKKILDVGCGNGHYSFLFERCGMDVIAFDFDKALIKHANEKKKELNSNVSFIIADGNFPDRFFTSKFGIIFLSGFALFSIDLDKELMEKYLSLLDLNGTLIFAHSSNLTGTIRKTHWRNHTIKELKFFFDSLDCTVEEIYFFERHILLKVFHSVIFNKFLTKTQIVLSKITKLPCRLVFVVKRKDQVSKLK